MSVPGFLTDASIPRSDHDVVKAGVLAALQRALSWPTGVPPALTHDNGIAAFARALRDAANAHEPDLVTLISLSMARAP